MGKSIHWDYAETFSGREVAYLIGGLEPSDWNVESEYKVRHIVARLKKSYYAAVKYMIDGAVDGAGFFADENNEYFATVDPFKRRIPKEDELWSFEIEDLIVKYNYQYAAAGIPEEFEFCYSDKRDLPFEEIKRRIDARLESVFTDEREVLQAVVDIIAGPVHHWALEHAHEFDDQKFSRDELCRWIRDNNIQSQYQFTRRDEATEKTLTTTERNSLLVVIAALCRNAGIDPLSRPAAGQIVRMCDEVGVAISNDTARNILRQTPDAVGTRGK